MIGGASKNEKNGEGLTGCRPAWLGVLRFVFLTQMGLCHIRYTQTFLLKLGQITVLAHNGTWLPAPPVAVYKHRTESHLRAVHITSPPLV